MITQQTASGIYIQREPKLQWHNYCITVSEYYPPEFLKHDNEGLFPPSPGDVIEWWNKNMLHLGPVPTPYQRADTSWHVPAWAKGFEDWEIILRVEVAA